MELSKLTKQEIQVLKYRCYGDKVAQIALKLHVHESEIYRIQASAFNKLNISGEGQARFENFQKVGCDELAKLTEDDIKDWDKNKPAPVQTPTRRNYLLYGILALMILVAYWLGTRQKTPVATPEPQLITQIVVVSATPEPLNPTPATPEPTLIPTNTLIDIAAILPTDTLIIPTNTRVIPTATFTLEPTLSPILFSDDFQIGLLPVWNVLLGEPLYVNGKLTTDSNLIMFTGDETWTDYAVTFDGHCSTAERSGSGGCLIAVRVLDTDNYIAYKFYDYEGWWITVTDGVEESITGSGYRSVYGNPEHYRITVEGNIFTTYINGNLKATVINTDYPYGGIGLKLISVTQLDNLVVTRLP